MAALALPLHATNRTVKAAGGGDCTVIQACVNLMAAGDTTTVFAGTYAETVTVSAGGVGNYKTITVNGSDTVSVLGFVLNSHVKLIGNCPAKAGTVTTATCGFFISNPSSSSTACVSLPNNTTDVYIRANVSAFCGTWIGTYPIKTTFIYIQGNTISYTNVPSVGAISGTCGGSGGTCVGNSLNMYGDHYVIENNDFSHYTLSLDHNSSNIVYRNNITHDQFESEAAGNGHTDFWFAEPGVANATQFNVIEGNIQRNAVGPNAKSFLDQNDTGNICASTCNNLIIRYNTISRIGGAVGDNTSGSDWPFIKDYNNSYVDSNEEEDLSTGGGGSVDNALNSTHTSFLNDIFYLTHAQNGGVSTINMYACGANCDPGYSDYWCTATCPHVNGHQYGLGNWSGDTGNVNVNPNFVSYVSAGSPSNNYNLQPGSPLIAAGRYLTTVANTDTGSGTALIVNDGSYFQDGYGLTNAFSTVSADCISVTTVSNHVCITAVNYSTNTLTLATGFTRAAGDHVWLYSKSDGAVVLTGSAPDMGAFPFIAPPASIFGSRTILLGQ
jgi:hypothetical protein